VVAHWLRDVMANCWRVMAAHWLQDCGGSLVLQCYGSLV
jgi:hypothetical protein